LERISSALEFEQRIGNLLQSLKFKVQPQVRIKGVPVDFLVQKEEYPFVISSVVEVKFYERSLVPASAVRRLLDLVEAVGVDRGILITTLGFTEEAIGIAHKYKDKIILLTESDLISQLSEHDKARYVKILRDSTYWRSQIGSEELRERLHEQVMQLPDKQISSILQKTLTSEELRRILSEKLASSQFVDRVIAEISPENFFSLIQTPAPARLPDETKKKIEEIYRSAIAETDPNKRGRLFEAVVAQILDLVPNLKVVGRDVLTSVEEIDLIVRNHNRDSVWRDFDGVFLAECKNVIKPPGPIDIDHFKSNMEKRQIRTSLLFSVKGISGDGNRDGWGAVRDHRNSGYKIVVLDGDDLEDIFRCVNVSDKVDEKYVELYKL
jgi:Restriction endonuclease